MVVTHWPTRVLVVLGLRRNVERWSRCRPTRRHFRSGLRQVVEGSEVQQELDRHRLELLAGTAGGGGQDRRGGRLLPRPLGAQRRDDAQPGSARPTRPQEGRAPQPVSFGNTQHLWYGGQSLKIAPGRGRHSFPLTIPRSSPQNNLLLIAVFNDSHGKRWPWDVRADTHYVRKGGWFELRDR